MPLSEKEVLPADINEGIVLGCTIPAADRTAFWKNKG
jgi:hypothetical protein